MGVIGEMKAQMDELRGMMKQVLENKKSQERAGNGAAQVKGISMDDPSVVAFFEGFAKYLQDKGYVSKKPLNRRNAAKDNAALTPDEVSSSISGSNLILWKLNDLKKRISDPNFASPLKEKNATANSAINNNNLNTWSGSRAKRVEAEYKKLFDTVNELKDVLGRLEIK